jgi:hypothetical protein
MDALYTNENGKPTLVMKGEWINGYRNSKRNAKE